jgi:hypothetical protein
MIDYLAITNATNAIVLVGYRYDCEEITAVY